MLLRRLLLAAAHRLLAAALGLLATLRASRRGLIGWRLLHRSLAAGGGLGPSLALRSGRRRPVGRLLLHPALAGRALRPGRHASDRHAERGDGPLVDHAGGLEALLTLERDQSFLRARAKLAIRPLAAKLAPAKGPVS